MIRSERLQLARPPVPASRAPVYRVDVETGASTIELEDAAWAVEGPLRTYRGVSWDLEEGC